MAMEIKNNIRQLIIIGSGPAGYTAGIYAGRALLKPLLFSGGEPGGQLVTTTDVENYPGFPEGIQGPELMQKFRDQARRFNTEIIDAAVERVDFTREPFKVWSNGKEYQSQSVLVATGASSLWLGLPSEQKLRGHGVSSCATCDGFFFKGKDIVVVGGGDSAMEEATFLTKFANQVTVLVRKNVLRASKIMQERAQNNPKVKFIFSSEVVEVLGENSVTGLKVKNTQSGQMKEVKCQGLFLAIGHKPNTDIFAGQLATDAKGYLVVKDHTHTSVAGVFAAGDVHDWHYRQAVTAAGAGCQAAMDAAKWLEK